MNVDRVLLGQLGAVRLAQAGLAAGPQLGDRRSPFRGRGMEFADHRPYHPGDDLRLVDWNVYRRLKQVLVRLFHEDRNIHVGMCVDASASMGAGDPRKLDHAGTLAAALALIGLKNRDTVTLTMAGGSGRHGRMRGHQASSFGGFLRAIEEAEPEGQPDLTDSIRKLTDRGRLDRMILLSDMLIDEHDRESALRALATAARFPVLLHVLSAEELEPDLSRGLQAVDAETDELVAVGEGKRAQKAYDEALKEFLASVRDRAAALKVMYVPAYTTVPVRELVLDSLRRGRVVESAKGSVR